MSKYKTRPIGEKFSIDGVELEVVEDIGCIGCYYHNSKEINCLSSEIFTTAGQCISSERHDNKSVIFKEVKK